MENKTTRTILIVFVAIVLVVCSFGGGVAVGHFLPLGTTPELSATSTATSGSQGGTPSDLQSLFAPFWQAWSIVHTYYVDQPVDNTKLMQGAINGMVNALGDAHTNFWTMDEYNQFMAQLNAQYAGIGAYVDVSGKLLTIKKPITSDTPAAKAGLQAGDQVVGIDGKDVTSLDPETVHQMVLGDAGTQVTLTILRPGQSKTFDVTITRAVITIPTVTSKMLDNNIAYIQLTDFGPNTAQDLHTQLQTLMAQNPKGIILDLRYNGGGYLDSGIAVASEFISSGVVVYQQAGDGTKTPYQAKPGGLATGSTPMIVLVNGETASAAEIVSGAIQDTGRGILLGEKTYGKGTVQTMVPLDNNQGVMHITIARWLTPKGRQIDKLGLTPDDPVTMTTDDINAGRDPQLDAAVQKLLNP